MLQANLSPVTILKGRLNTALKPYQIFYTKPVHNIPKQMVQQGEELTKVNPQFFC